MVELAVVEAASVRPLQSLCPPTTSGTRRSGEVRRPLWLEGTHLRLLPVDNGASLPELQRLLGHRDLSTTQVYLAVTGSGLEQTAMANPARALLRKPTPPPQVDPPAE